MPSELFTSAPHWQWWVILYFFVGGIAGGSYFLAAMLDLFGRPGDRALSRIGYLIATPAIAIGAVLLIVDLGRMERFWHMLIQSETGELMIKWWSPISFATWGITLFGLLSGISFLAALVRPGEEPQWGPLRPFHKLQYGLGIISKIFIGITALLGLFVASYTGWLLATTNRPLWANTTLFGLLFMFSGVSSAAALMIVIARWRRGVSRGSVESLIEFDDWTLIVELIAIVIVVALVLPVLYYAPLDWLLFWGALLVIGVMIAGVLVPLVLQMRFPSSTRAPIVAALLVLLGSFLLRTVVIMSSETLQVVRV